MPLFEVFTSDNSCHGNLHVLGTNNYVKLTGNFLHKGTVSAQDRVHDTHTHTHARTHTHTQTHAHAHAHAHVRAHTHTHTHSLTHSNTDSSCQNTISPSVNCALKPANLTTCMPTTSCRTRTLLYWHYYTIAPSKCQNAHVNIQAAAVTRNSHSCTFLPCQSHSTSSEAEQCIPTATYN